MLQAVGDGQRHDPDQVGAQEDRVGGAATRPADDICHPMDRVSPAVLQQRVCAYRQAGEQRRGDDALTLLGRARDGRDGDEDGHVAQPGVQSLRPLVRTPQRPPWSDAAQCRHHVCAGQ